MAGVMSELEAAEMVTEGLSSVIADLTRRNRDLERALWVALAGKEVVVRDDTPRRIEWRETEDGGRLVRRIT